MTAEKFVFCHFFSFIYPSGTGQTSQTYTVCESSSRMGTSHETRSFVLEMEISLSGPIKYAISTFSNLFGQIVRLKMGHAIYLHFRCASNWQLISHIIIEEIKNWFFIQHSICSWSFDKRNMELISSIHLTRWPDSARTFYLFSFSFEWFSIRNVSSDTQYQPA